MLYDDLDLQMKDSDDRLRWGGVSRLPPPRMAASGPENTFSVTTPVADLQRDLRTLGFLLAPEPDGEFGLETQWAVREFQIYAKMERVAREDTASEATAYADRLSQVPTGKHRYTGPVSGVVNAATRAALKHWLKESWRCPVVIDAWTKKNPPTRAIENLWKHDQGAGDHVIKALDLTDYYQPQPPGQLWAVGKSGKYTDDRGALHRGPQSTSEHAWQDAEVLPETLVGSEWSALGAAERSTFKVVRAVSEVECYGFFDAVNAYDQAIVSTGIFQFTFLDGVGELCGLLDELAAHHPGDYERAIAFFGMDVRGAGAGAQRSRPAVRLQNDSGGLEPVNKQPWINYIRNWHWFYRYEMMGRTVASYRRRMWPAAIRRIRKILSLTFAEGDVTAVGANPRGQPILATIGHAFTSELAVGYLLRWHVNLPGNIASGGSAGPRVIEMLNAAKELQPGLDWTLAPTQWTQAHEDALLNAIATMKKPNTVLTDTIPQIATPQRNPRWRIDRKVITPLSRDRGSFQLATAPAPAQPAQPPAPAPPAQPPGPLQPPAGPGQAGP